MTARANQRRERTRSILSLMISQPGYAWTARTIAERVWPVLGGGTSRRSGQWKSMGNVLAGLERSGLVERSLTEFNQKTWTATPKGRKMAVASQTSEEES